MVSSIYGRVCALPRNLKVTIAYRHAIRMTKMLRTFVFFFIAPEQSLTGTKICITIITFISKVQKEVIYEA